MRRNAVSPGGWVCSVVIFKNNQFLVILLAVALHCMLDRSAFSQSIDKLYYKQQQDAVSRYEKNKKYCTALFEKADYEVRSDENEGRVVQRYYIQGGVLKSIGPFQPAENGASCNRWEINNRIIGKTYTVRVKLGDAGILSIHEIQKQRLDPNKIIRSDQVLLKIESDAIIEYKKDLITGKISRRIIAQRRHSTSRTFSIPARPEADDADGPLQQATAGGGQNRSVVERPEPNHRIRGLAELIDLKP